MVPPIFVKVPPEVNELCHCINPVFPVKLMEGKDPGIVPLQKVDVPESVAVPATDVGFTFTVAVIVADGQTPLVTTA